MLDHNIFIFDYEFNYDILEMYWDIHEQRLKGYTDPRIEGDLDQWKIARLEMFDYAQELCDTFGIKNGKPRFYKLEANTELPMHVDYGTTCSLNIALSDGNAPVKFMDKEYAYKSAILNTGNTHGVVNGPTDRRLFKISVFDQTFEEVCDNISKSIKHHTSV